jgi:3-oxoadipate enol-lactonase
MGERGVTRTCGTVASGGERIYFETVGRGSPVVLCHGLGGNHGVWWQQVHALAQDHFVITWDQRGFGNSTCTTGVIGPRPAVEDLIALLEHLALNSVHLVGQSMGGWVALGTAVTHPNRAVSLVLTDTLAGVHTPEIAAIVQRSRSTHATSPRPEAFAEHPALSQRFCERDPDRAYLYQQLSSVGNKPDEREVGLTLGETRWPLDKIASLDVPTLVIVGAEDRLCPPSAVKLVADRIPGARFHELPGCGHSAYFEDPATWNPLVLEFLRASSQ